jgi:hypothetical protein
MARSKRTQSRKLIQPTPIAGVLPTGLYSARDEENRIIMLDFTYNPAGSDDGYIVARVHLTPDVAKWTRDAIDKFLKKIPEKK